MDALRRGLALSPLRRHLLAEAVPVLLVCRVGLAVGSVATVAWVLDATTSALAWVHTPRLAPLADLVWAVETADEICREIGAEAWLEPGLGEHRNAEWFDAEPEILSNQALTARFDPIRDDHEPSLHPTFPETHAEASARVGETATRIVEDEAGTVLLVGHGLTVGGVVEGLVGSIAGVDAPLCGITRIERVAERTGDKYMVDGQKVWVGNAQTADLLLLMARTSPRDESDRFDGLSLFLTPFDATDGTVDVSEMEKAGRRAIDSNEVWFEDFSIPVADRIGEEGEGFTYLLEFANSERITVAAAAVGIGQAAIEAASQYASERVVFDNPIGSYQGIQHPLADSWSKLQQAEVMTRYAATLYDEGMDCGGEANAVKLRASETCVEACERAVRALGGMGYAEEYDVPRYWRESILTVISPVSNELVLNYIGTKELGMPKSY